jgi:ferrochelatase
VSEAPAYDAVLLASFGGPEGPDEVIPFLERVTAGRGVPPERLAAVGEHYFALGGVSPINAQNRALIAALEAEFARRGIDLPIAFGNRNSAPFFADALRDLHAAGHRRILALATSAYSSYSGCRQYRENLARALDETGLADELEIVKVRPFSDRPGFVGPFADALAEALGALAADAVPVDATRVVFTTHSIPTAMDRSSGPDEEPAADVGEYIRQHLVACEAVMGLVRDRGRDVPAWSLAYQSRSGSPEVPWLEPDIGDVIAALAADGVQAVVNAPIGFISDHVEVIWDLDHEAREAADEHGVRFERVATPGTAPAFIAALADLVEEALGGEALEHQPTWRRLCGRHCCPNLRQGDLATIPGR